MPYTYEQCQLFGAKARRGEKVPADWKEHCKGVEKPDAKKAFMKATENRRSST